MYIYIQFVYIHINVFVALPSMVLTALLPNANIGTILLHTVVSMYISISISISIYIYIYISIYILQKIFGL